MSFIRLHDKRRGAESSRPTWPSASLIYAPNFGTYKDSCPRPRIPSANTTPRTLFPFASYRWVPPLPFPARTGMSPTRVVQARDFYTTDPISNLDILAASAIPLLFYFDLSTYRTIHWLSHYVPYALPLLVRSAEKRRLRSAPNAVRCDRPKMALACVDWTGVSLRPFRER